MSQLTRIVTNLTAMSHQKSFVMLMLQNLSIHYRLAGAEYNHFAQIGWDVIAFDVVVLFVIVFLPSKFVVFVSRSFIAKMQMKRKTE